MVTKSEVENIWHGAPLSYFRRVLIKSNALYYRNRSNSPFLSGDTFRFQADLDISSLPLNDREMAILPQARVLFCKSNLLQSFIGLHKRDIAAKVILCGNSDFEFHDVQLELPYSVKACFLQNSYISDDERIFPLPIGLENVRLGTNGIPRIFNVDAEWESKKNRLLIGPFSLTHDERRMLKEFASEEIASVDFGLKRLTPKSLARVNSSYMKIAAVRGNGVDTHRLWEILYLGSIPIIKRDSWSLSLRKLNLPLEYVDCWSPTEISRVAQGDYCKPPKPSQLESLWWPYWKKRIEAYC